MDISVLSVFSDLYVPFFKTSLMNRAQEKGIISCAVETFFSHVAPKERIDAPIYGHGAGMLIKPEVVERAIEAREKQCGKAYKVFFSPQGKKLDQCLVREIAQKAQQAGHLMLVSARYEGMDARVEEYYADEMVSVGDFVLLSGDLAAMLLIEAVVRCVPGVVGKAESVEQESFSGPFVEYPHYTEPVEWHGMHVPEVVRSGNHQAVDQWRLQESAKRTVFGHFDWLRASALSTKDRSIASSCLPAHYCALMHTDVLIGKQQEPGTTSITSIDIHDIARSSCTYGLEGFFVVTPLLDQQKIAQKLIDFWMSDVGIDYNIHRHESISLVSLAPSFEAVCDEIEKREGKRPVVIATSARGTKHHAPITFNDQTRVWASGRPILLLFGTGRGLQEKRIHEADFLLPPVEGFPEYNHLSVRSAAAVVFDRWLGLQPKKVH